MNISDEFDKVPDAHWTQVTTGGAYLKTSKSVIRMGYDSAKPGKYTDAQIDDYTMLSKSEYIWKPPLRMTVRARFSHLAASANSTTRTKGILRGTAGFGFWNKPFTMQGNWFTLPQSIWFFYSAPPSNMALVPGLPGQGWKTQVINTTFTGVIANVIPTAFNALFGRIQKRFYPSGKALRRFAGAHETLIHEDMTKWHTYTLEWHKNESLFWIDDTLIAKVPTAPTKPLGFVAWLDNEYCVVTPRGELRFGKTTSSQQWLDVDLSLIHI